MKFAHTDYGSIREIIKVNASQYAFITLSESKEIVLHVIESISDIDAGS